jgi:hypothetical protein
LGPQIATLRVELQSDVLDKSCMAFAVHARAMQQLLSSLGWQLKFACMNDHKCCVLVCACVVERARLNNGVTLRPYYI